MSKPCRVLGCRCEARNFGGFGIYCDAHQKRLRRHGHPEQVAIDKRHLAPIFSRVVERRRKNASPLIWENIEKRWDVVVAEAEAVRARRITGAASSSHEARAADAVLRLAESVTAAEVVDTVVALYLLQKDDPRRFRSDEAFKFQLVRRVLGLTETNATRHVDPRTGAAKLAYRDPPPGVVRVLAGWITAALGPVGLHIARLEENEAAQVSEEAAAFHAALAAIR